MIRSFLNNPMHRFSIRTKLIVIVCIFIFYPLLFVGYLGYRNYEEIMKSKFIHYAHNNVKELSTLVGNEIESLNTFAMNILYDNKIYEKHAQLKKNTDFSGILYQRRTGSLSAVYSSFQIGNQQDFF